MRDSCLNRLIAEGKKEKFNSPDGCSHIGLRTLAGQKNRKGWTPFQCALVAGDANQCSFLLSHGVDLTLPDLQMRKTRECYYYYYSYPYHPLTLVCISAYEELAFLIESDLPFDSSREQRYVQ